MRLLRLQDDAPGGVRLELHPRLSVATGLPADARSRLAAALGELPRAAGGAALDGVSGEVEVSGILLDLEPGALALLDLDADLDLVVGADDLLALADAGVASPGPDTGDGPGGGSAPVDADAVRRAVRDATATHDVLAASLAELQDAHRRVLARRSSLALALASAGARPAPSGHPADPRPDAGDLRGEVNPATHTVMRAATVVLDSPGPSPEAVAAIASTAARVDRLRTRRDELLGALAPLVDIDVAAVADAVAAVQARPDVEEVPDVEAQRLADALVAAIEALDAYDAQVEATGHGPLAAYRRLDEAQRRFLAADAAVRPPVIDPADAEALEAAHDELLEAELKLTAARIPGKSLKKRLDDAAAAEQVVLERMGFATYTAYVMSTSVPLVSPELRTVHERAQRDWEQAEVVFREAVAAAEADPQRSALVATVEATRDAARTLVGDLDEPELEAALRARTVVEDQAADLAAGAVDELRAALGTVGVDFGDLALTDDEVVDVAVVWLADMDEALRERGELEEALASIEDEIAGAELDLAQLETSAPNLADLGAVVAPAEATPSPPPAPAEPAAPTHDAAAVDLGDAALDDLETGLAEIDAELRVLDEQIDAQSALLDAAARALSSAQAQAAAVDVAGGGEAFAVATTIAAVDGRAATVAPVERIEWYLLSRLAELRSVSYAGSLPLVLDEPFGHVADDDVDYLLERLVRMSDAVQVVFLGDDPRVVRWAASAGDEVAAVLTL